MNMINEQPKNTCMQMVKILFNIYLLKHNFHSNVFFNDNFLSNKLFLLLRRVFLSQRLQQSLQIQLSRKPNVPTLFQPTPTLCFTLPLCRDWKWRFRSAQIRFVSVGYQRPSFALTVLTSVNHQPIFVSFSFFLSLFPLYYIIILIFPFYLFIYFYFCLFSFYYYYYYYYYF